MEGQVAAVSKSRISVVGGAGGGAARARPWAAGPKLAVAGGIRQPAKAGAGPLGQARESLGVGADSPWRKRSFGSRVMVTLVWFDPSDDLVNLSNSGRAGGDDKVRIIPWSPGPS